MLEVGGKLCLLTSWFGWVFGSKTALIFGIILAVVSADLFLALDYLYEVWSWSLECGPCAGGSRALWAVSWGDPP
jgi:hypothetical protein